MYQSKDFRNYQNKGIPPNMFLNLRGLNLLRDNVTFVPEASADYVFRCNLELNGTVCKKYWIPLIYKNRTRKFVLEVSFLVVERSTGRIYYEKKVAANAFFKEYYISEIIGPFNITDYYLSDNSRETN